MTPLAFTGNSDIGGLLNKKFQNPTFLLRWDRVYSAPTQIWSSENFQYIWNMMIYCKNMSTRQ